ncbi:MAG: chromosomal replication initiator DnaA [Paracoccaceae bacterium]
MARQLTFDLPARPALGRDDFFVSPANAVAVKAIENWSDWPERKLLLTGPNGSGKTHLVHVWAQAAGAKVIEAKDLDAGNVDRLVAENSAVAVEDIEIISGNDAAEHAFFHLHNMLLAESGYLLLTSASLPANWSLSLPDLKSRIQGTALATLKAPDDALLAAVLVKLFADRQISVPAGVVAQLVPRMERSFEFAQRLVRALDQQSLSEHRAITTALATRVLDNLSLGAP